eukprot:TRINITY_DN490_c1_g1_i1.p1 TRINITY_DN490_c1_g1~~TRINITY_DN490_c1_g1_i1.p1  ORF type:complete len:846 (+),score=164.26 TRINITY_DN490_c1_g1_i1:170-2707(+)
MDDMNLIKKLIPKSEQNSDEQPEGGYDPTSFPDVPHGYTLLFTFHSGHNLPLADSPLDLHTHHHPLRGPLDLLTNNCDPYLYVHLKTDTPTRHPELDSKLRIRTPTIQRCTNPVWEHRWEVGGVPASGFKLKVRVYDEDRDSRDDRIGSTAFSVDHIDEQWAGIDHGEYELSKKKMDKVALLTNVALSLAAMKNPRDSWGSIKVSVRLVGKTMGKKGRPPFTIGPCHWSQHYSPFVGRITGTLDGDQKRQRESYVFQASQLQLRGPVPEHFYHRFVEFTSFVKPLFTNTGIEGRVLNHGLHVQHNTVYNYNPYTTYGTINNMPADPTYLYDEPENLSHKLHKLSEQMNEPPKPQVASSSAPQKSPEAQLEDAKNRSASEYDKEYGPSDTLARRFLRMTKFAQGYRLFTYIITTDGQMRFTETGKEFGVDQLSKHTMHSNASIYIAFSGEFFLRRRRRLRGNALATDESWKKQEAANLAMAQPQRKLGKLCDLPGRVAQHLPLLPVNPQSQEYEDEMAPGKNAQNQQKQSNTNSSNRTSKNSDERSREIQASSADYDDDDDSVDSAGEFDTDIEDDDSDDEVTPVQTQSSGELTRGGVSASNYAVSSAADDYVPNEQEQAAAQADWDNAVDADSGSDSDSDSEPSSSRPKTTSAVPGEECQLGFDPPAPKTGKHLFKKAKQFAKPSDDDDSDSDKDDAADAKNSSNTAAPANGKKFRGHRHRKEEEELENNPAISKNPEDYILVIDNDSGTYRPNKKLLPLLRAFLRAQFVGMHVRTMDCGSSRLQRWKQNQRDRKKALYAARKTRWISWKKPPVTLKLLEDSDDDEDDMQHPDKAKLSKKDKKKK